MDKETAISVKDVKVRYYITGQTGEGLSWKKRKEGRVVVEAIRGVSFDIFEGEIVGLIGCNGCGKSTLLRTVAGIFSPDEGSIDLNGNSVSLMSIGVGFHPNLTGRENVILSGMLLGYTKKQVLERMQDIIEFSELEEFIDLPVRTYSSGMHSKLAFSISSNLESDIILIDEVLGVGDQHFKHKSFRRMKSMILDQRHTVILVSHDVTKMERLCNRIIWMEKGLIRKIGAPAEIIREYMEEEGLENEL